MNKAVTLQSQVGETKQPVATFLNDQLLPKLPPKEQFLLWREPVPTRQRVPGFEGLLLVDCTFSDDTPLDEARLWWPGGSVHLVSTCYGAKAAGSHWCVVHEHSDDDSPGWLAPLISSGSSLPSRELSRHQGGAAELLRDRNRYGLGKAAMVLDHLTVIEYRSGTELAHWRLEKVPQGTGTTRAAESGELHDA